MVRSGFTLVVGLAVVLAGCGDEASSPPASSGQPAPGAPRLSPAEASSLGLTRRLPAAYRAACDEQAGYAPLGARVCPPLVPVGRMRVEFAGPFSRLERLRGGYSADLGSAVLDELDGERIETNGGHWHYDVAWTPAVRRSVLERGVLRPRDATEPSACRDLRLGAQRVQACRVVPYEQGGGLNGGHVVYVWRHKETVFVLSVHGYRNEPRVRAMLAAWIAEVLE